MNTEIHIPVRDEKVLFIEPYQEEQQKCKGHCKSRKILSVFFYIACFYLIFAFSNIGGSSEDETDLFALSSGVCKETPSIPFDGQNEFTIDSLQYHGLEIKEKSQKAKYLSVSSGETTVIEDASTDKIYVKLDIKLSDEALQDSISIDISDDDGVYTIAVNLDGNDNVINDACIQINAIVTLPSTNALSSLDIALTNNNIHVESAFSFDDLSLAVVNGGIEINEGIHTGVTALTIANGDIDATIESLKDNLDVSIANGHVQIKIVDIEPKGEDEGIQIRSAVANGRNEIDVPVSFESKFELKSILGKKLIESSEPNKIHLRSSGWGSSNGYYGDHEDTKNKIFLSSVNGNLLLIYE